MKLEINRESVCAGDDTFDHTEFFDMEDCADYEDLFYLLKAKHYFPNISGNNVVWVLTTEQNVCILSYFTKTDKLSMVSSEKSLKKLCGSSGRFYLRYFSSPLKWKKEILAGYSIDCSFLQPGAWQEELKYCDDMLKDAKPKSSSPDPQAYSDILII